MYRLVAWILTVLVFSLGLHGCSRATRPVAASEPWTRSSDGLPEPVVGVVGVFAIAANSTTLFAGTDGAGVFHSVDGGFKWEAWATEHSGSIISLAASDTTLITASYGGTLRSTNGGATWVSVAEGLGLVSAFTRRGRTLLAGTNVGVIRSTDDGITWVAATTQPTALRILSLTTASESTLLAGTYDGVFRSTDDGITWAPATTQPRSAGILSLAASGTTLLAGTYDGVFWSTDDGITWIPATTQPTVGNFPHPRTAYILSLAAIGTTLLAATESGVFRSTDGGVTWLQDPTQPMGRTVSLFASGRTFLAGTSSNGIWRSRLSQ